MFHDNFAIIDIAYSAQSTLLYSRKCCDTAITSPLLPDAPPTVASARHAPHNWVPPQPRHRVREKAFDDCDSEEESRNAVWTVWRSKRPRAETSAAEHAADASVDGNGDNNDNALGPRM